MKSAAKWLIAGGAFILVIVFLLPVISVASTSKSVSLLQIAGVPYLFLLYLFPLGALTTLILALVPANNRTTRNLFLIGQVMGLGLGLLLLVGLLAYFAFWSLNKQDPLKFGSNLLAECQTACEVWPGIGFFVSFLGFGLAIFGLVVKYFPFLEGISKRWASQTVSSEVVSPPEHKVEAVAGGPRLEFKQGELANQTIAVKGDDFSIGRGRDNDLQLVDPERKISRVHARLRFAQNTLFLQDQDSKIGTFVNGKRVKATRLDPGDEIRIGGNSFIFRS
jgi:hypothetical protein